MPVPRSSGTRIAAVLVIVLAAAVVLPLVARGASSRWHDDSLWSNALRSVGGVAVPFDFAVFLRAAEDVRSADNPYIDPDAIGKDARTPYAYPPVLAIALVPATALPERVGGSSPAGVLFSLLLVACVLGTLVALGVQDWRCYPVALLYPATIENLEYGSIGPILALLVALGWRHRDRVARVTAAVGVAVVLKVFLWPLVVWLAVTRRWSAALASAAAALGLALLSWAAIGFRGLAEYPALLRNLSDLEAENSYSALALLQAAGAPEPLARALVVLLALGLLGLAWAAARGDSTYREEGDRRSLTLALAAGFVLTPILWLHYLVLLIVPIALARPRLSALWFIPLSMTVFELLDWYRGWPRGDGWALASVAVIVGLVFAVSAWPRGSAGTARRAPARS